MISCHKYNLKPSLVQYIYPISYKIAKRQTPEKRICPIENYRCAIRAKMSDISQVFEVDDILRMWEDILNDQFLW